MQKVVRISMFKHLAEFNRGAVISVALNADLALG